jgi:hypothetical protein
MDQTHIESAPKRVRLDRACPHAERMAAGCPLGRKIGFTNRSIWLRYGVYQPMDLPTTGPRPRRPPTPRRACVAGFWPSRALEPEICFLALGEVKPRSSDPLT